MALLRNLRNIIQAGVDEKYHQQIIRRLQDEVRSVNIKIPTNLFVQWESNLFSVCLNFLIPVS